METFEDLGALMGPVEFDREAVIERAVVAGRRRQRRRRIGAGGGVLAVVALVGGTSLHVGGSPVAVDSSLATSPPAVSPATPTVTPTEGQDDAPSPALADSRLAARLPVPGDPVSARNFGRSVYVERTLDPDGSGTGSVTLALSAEKPLSQSQISGEAGKCRMVADLTGPESCRRIAHGWLFSVTGHPDIENASSRALDWSATANFEDGTSVQVHATNYVEQQDPTRPRPVLDMDQISALVTDPVWFQPAP
jgi:hypothetical protein